MHELVLERESSMGAMEEGVGGSPMEEGEAGSLPEELEVIEGEAPPCSSIARVSHGERGGARRGGVRLTKGGEALVS